MVDFHAGFEPSPRKFEIVKGKEYSANQTSFMLTTTNRPRYSLPLPPPPVVGNLSQPPPTSRTRSRSKPMKTKFSSVDFNGRESKRRNRVLKYKLYAVESKVRSSFTKGVRWIKNKCSKIANQF